MHATFRTWLTRRRLWLWLVVVMVVTASGWAGLRERAAERSARAARRALASGRYAEARAQARVWLRRRPTADAHYVLARAAMALEDPALFRAHAQRAVRRGLGPTKQALLHALVDAGRGRYAQAEPALLAAIAAGEGPDPQIDHALARIYLETFRLRQAAAVLDRWAAGAPGDPQPYLWRAEVDRRVEHSPEALERDYRQALARDPHSPAARLGLADALLELRRYDEARRQFDAYLALRPADPAGHIGAARAALAQADDPAATRHLAAALAHDPAHVKALALQADVAARHGDLSTALGALDRAIEGAPGEVDIHYQRALILARLGRRADAARAQTVVDRLRADHSRLNALKEKLLQSPHDDDLKAEIGRWMLDHGHDEDARRWAADILQRTPTHRLANQILRAYYSHRGQSGLANYYRLQAGETNPPSSMHEMRH